MNFDDDAQNVALMQRTAISNSGMTHIIREVCSGLGLVEADPKPFSSPLTSNLFVSSATHAFDVDKLLETKTDGGTFVFQPTVRAKPNHLRWWGAEAFLNPVNTMCSVMVQNGDIGAIEQVLETIIETLGIKPSAIEGFCHPDFYEKLDSTKQANVVQAKTNILCSQTATGAEAKSGWYCRLYVPIDTGYCHAFDLNWLDDQNAKSTVELAFSLENQVTLQQNKQTVYETTLFEKTYEAANRFITKSRRMYRILALAHGISYLVLNEVPVSNKGQGFILKKFAKMLAEELRLNNNSITTQEVQTIVTETLRAGLEDLIQQRDVNTNRDAQSVDLNGIVKIIENFVQKRQQDLVRLQRGDFEGMTKERLMDERGFLVSDFEPDGLTEQHYYRGTICPTFGNDKYTRAHLENLLGYVR